MAPLHLETCASFCTNYHPDWTPENGLEGCPDQHRCWCPDGSLSYDEYNRLHPARQKWAAWEAKREDQGRPILRARG